MLAVQDLFKSGRLKEHVPLPLPDPDRTVLSRAPLDLVICQLRFDPRPSIDAQIALRVHEDLGGETGDYARLDSVQAQTVNLAFGPGVAPTASQTQPVPGWRYHSVDGLWIASLMPDHVALETPRYPSWDAFRERMHRLIDATSRHVAPGIEQRLGLRYIDRVAGIEARTPADWRPYLVPELLGLVSGGVLGDAVTGGRQQLVLDLGEGFACSFTHGFLPGEQDQLHYLLDYDVYREGGRAFNADGVKAALDVLNDDALKLFQASITPALRDALNS